MGEWRYNPTHSWVEVSDNFMPQSLYLPGKCWYHLRYYILFTSTSVWGRNSVAVFLIVCRISDSPRRKSSRSVAQNRDNLVSFCSLSLFACAFSDESTSVTAHARELDGVGLLEKCI